MCKDCETRTCLLSGLFYLFRKGYAIYEQMKRLGASLDWQRATFTLDEVGAVCMCTQAPLHTHTHTHTHTHKNHDTHTHTHTHTHSVYDPVLSEPCVITLRNSEIKQNEVQHSNTERQIISR